jgi:hypothetical protein
LGSASSPGSCSGTPQRQQQQQQQQQQPDCKESTVVCKVGCRCLASYCPWQNVWAPSWGKTNTIASANSGDMHRVLPCLAVNMIENKAKQRARQLDATCGVLLCPNMLKSNAQFSRHISAARSQANKFLG